MNSNFKLNLKVSAFYLEKQKSFIPKNIYFLAVVSNYAKRDPIDGVCCPNFQRRFWVKSETKLVAHFDLNIFDLETKTN